MRRRAFSVIEVTVALILLTLTAGALGQFVASVQQGLRDRELSSCLGWELENARARVSTWKLKDISVESIERIQVSEAVCSRLPDAHWKVTVEPIREPVLALQVTLQLQCTIHGQAAEPARLTFWVDAAADPGDQSERL